MTRSIRAILKKTLACVMSAALLVSLFPMEANAQTTTRKAIKYVEDFSKESLLDYNKGPILFPKDTFSGKREVTEEPLLAGHTCPNYHGNEAPVDHYEKFGFTFIGDVGDVSVATKTTKIIAGGAAGTNKYEYEEVTYNSKLTAKNKIVRLTYDGQPDITINYTKCEQGFPYDKYTYSIGTKVKVESLPSNAYKIKYDLGGGKVSSKKKLPTKVEIAPEYQIVSFEMPTQKGYQFCGWEFYNEAGEMLWGDIHYLHGNLFYVAGLQNENWDSVKNTIGGTITAKAVWEKKTYSKGSSFYDSVVSFDNANGSLGNAWYKITSAKYGAMKVSCVGSYYYGATGTTDIVIDEIVYGGAPFTVTAIEEDAFNESYSSDIKSITIKSTKITKMGKNAFAGLDKSTVIKVPKKMKKKYTAMLKASGFKGKIKTI